MKINNLFLAALVLLFSSFGYAVNDDMNNDMSVEEEPEMITQEEYEGEIMLEEEVPEKEIMTDEEFEHGVAEEEFEGEMVEE